MATNKKGPSPPAQRRRTQSSPRKSLTPEGVFDQHGGRWFFITLGIALLFGVILRHATSSSRMTSLIRENIERSPVAENLTFSQAALSLADGWKPEIAFLLERAEWRTDSRCQEIAPIQMKRLRVPIQFLPLLSGEALVAEAKVEGLAIDLDALKTPCGGTTAKSFSVAAATTGGDASDKSSAEGKVGKSYVPTLNADVREQLQAMIRGLRVNRAELFFERRMKSVLLEDFAAEWRGEDLEIATGVRFPPSTVFGEAIPPFFVSGTIRKDDINVEVRADLNEGTLDASATLRPFRQLAGGLELDSEVRVAVQDLPLSVITPVFRKAGMVDEVFKPRFAWLDCAAEVKGVFSRLIIQHPIRLSQCEVSGHLGRVRLESAVRDPSGTWSADSGNGGGNGKGFEVIFDPLVIGRALEAFGKGDHPAVFSDLGQFTGRLLVDDPSHVSISGKSTGTQLKFVNGEATAIQSVSIGRIDGNYNGRRLEFRLTDIVPDGGKADLVGTLSTEFGRNGVGLMSMLLSGPTLKLNPRVEKVLFPGPVDNLAVQAAWTVSGERLSGAKLKVDGSGINGDDISVEKFRLSGQLAKMPRATSSKALTVETGSAKPAAAEPATDAAFDIELEIPEMALKPGNSLLRFVRPTLFEWSGPNAEEPWTVDHFSLRGRLDRGGLAWAKASADIPTSNGAKIVFSSAGRLQADDSIEINLDVLYPSTKKLKWSVSGKWSKPTHVGISPELNGVGPRPNLKMLGL